jgi:NAD(P)-dependent dehydrogenase (short-subunit alcohol dehydrogenase family)/acyl carrier protein
LLENGATHVVLTARHGADEATRQSIAAIEARRHGTLAVHTADVADEAQVQGLLAGFGRDRPELAGVIHAAGVLDDGVITEQTVDRFEHVARPKMLGAWNLHRFTEPRALDFFVLYGSVASVLGSAGQANYAAANAFLDGLAEYRRALGLSATVIHWGPWAEGGMAGRARVRAQMARQGITLLEAGDAHRAMALLVGSGNPGGIVLDVDWSRMGKQLGNVRSALLRDLLPEAPPPGERDLPKRLREAPAAERQRMLVQHLQREVQRILGLVEPPPVNTGFFDLGMDSLMAIELRRRLESELGCSLAATLVMDRPNIERAAEYLAANALPPLPMETLAVTDGEAIRQINAAFEGMHP